MNNYKEKYLEWLSGDVFDKETKAELKSVTDEKEIEDRFYKDLSFGTGGLRGIIGAGTNRMNKYTVGKASQGLSDYINETTANGSVAIAYDSRRMSKEFALSSALVFAANGITAYLFEELRPTPELSFAVRHLKTTAGVVITASHNPPEYNGYKVYLGDGAQIVAPYDKRIIEKVNAVSDFSLIKTTDETSAVKSGKLKFIGKEIDDAYIAAVKSVVLNRDCIKKFADELKIVYTPLNGTGKTPVLRALKELGFNKVWTVKEQTEPDGNFPTLKYPNPEDPAAFDLALKLAKEVDADIVMATDPDADRLGIYAKDENGDYLPFTGNMSGALLCEYELSQKKEKGMLPKNTKDAVIISTVVTSDMAKSIANFYGVTHKEVLTGFKYIGEQINLYEKAIENNERNFSADKGAYDYVFGYEESYGCLIGTHARDKDAVVAVTALSEAAAYYKSKGISLCDQMQNIYKKYGYYKEILFTQTLAGKDGADRIKTLSEKFRNLGTEEIGGQKIVAVRDYLKSERKSADGLTSVIDLPKSDVTYFELENGWCCVRPSGTEPKIKFYVGVKGESSKDADEKINLIKKHLLFIVEDD